jgi:hypothetical protein
MATRKKKAAPAAKALYWELMYEHYNPWGTGPDSFTYRAQVPGGWLVATWAGTPKEHGQGGGLAFVPDADHTWKVKFRKPRGLKSVNQHYK